MAVTIVEIKARTRDADSIRKTLEDLEALVVGTDLQSDTYYRVPRGRLKLRQGPIENTLIFYNRANQAAPKTSHVQLYKADHLAEIKPLLDAAFDHLVTVNKRREIYFIGHVKFHIDVVEGLGEFVEIEAIDETGKIPESQLRDACDHYLQLLGINEADLMTHSYSDMILAHGE